MSKQNISIERLQIRLKGVSAHVARTAVSELGHELLGQLASSGQPQDAGRNVRAGEIEIGTVRLSGETGPAELRRVITQNVAASINSKMK
jgi:hypothetical protein